MIAFLKNEDDKIEFAARAVAAATIVSELKAKGVSPEAAAARIGEIAEKANEAAETAMPLVLAAFEAALKGGLEEHVAVGIACTPIITLLKRAAESLPQQDRKETRE